MKILAAVVADAVLNQAVVDVESADPQKAFEGKSLLEALSPNSEADRKKAVELYSQAGSKARDILRRNMLKSPRVLVEAFDFDMNAELLKELADASKEIQYQKSIPPSPGSTALQIRLRARLETVDDHNLPALLNLFRCFKNLDPDSIAALGELGADRDPEIQRRLQGLVRGLSKTEILQAIDNPKTRIGAANLLFLGLPKLKPVEIDEIRGVLLARAENAQGPTENKALLEALTTTILTPSEVSRLVTHLKQITPETARRESFEGLAPAICKNCVGQEIEAFFDRNPSVEQVDELLRFNSDKFNIRQAALRRQAKIKGPIDPITRKNLNFIINSGSGLGEFAVAALDSAGIVDPNEHAMLLKAAHLANNSGYRDQALRALIHHFMDEQTLRLALEGLSDESRVSPIISSLADLETNDFAKLSLNQRRELASRLVESSIQGNSRANASIALTKLVESDPSFKLDADDFTKLETAKDQPKSAREFVKKFGPAYCRVDTFDSEQRNSP